MIVSGSGTLITQRDQRNSRQESQSPAKRQANGQDPFTPPNRAHQRKKSVGAQKYSSAKAVPLDARSKQTTESRLNKVEERAQRIYKYNDASVKQQADQIRKMELNSSGLLAKQKRTQVKQRLHAMTSDALDDDIQNKIKQYKNESMGNGNLRDSATKLTSYTKQENIMLPNIKNFSKF